MITCPSGYFWRDHDDGRCSCPRIAEKKSPREYTNEEAAAIEAYWQAKQGDEYGSY